MGYCGAYWIMDNQQACSRLSNDSFSLCCLGPWMNHLPPVCWSLLCVGFCMKLVCKFCRVEMISVDFLPLVMVSYTTFPLELFYSDVIFYTKQLIYPIQSISNRCSLFSFSLHLRKGDGKPLYRKSKNGAAWYEDKLALLHGTIYPLMYHESMF